MNHTITHLEVQGAEALLPAMLRPAHAGAAKSDQLMVFLHGGNFLSKCSEAQEDFFQRLSEAIPSLAMLAPHYTLANARPFPAPLEDVVSVLQSLGRHKNKLGWNGKQLIVAGVEAGATLAAAAALVCRDRRGPTLDAQILLMPMLDPTLASRSMRESGEGQYLAAERCASGYQGYLPNAADRVHPYATPLYSSRLKGLPPALIFSAEGDPLRDEAEMYAVKLIDAGVPTSVVRLPPIALDAQDARSACAASDQVIQAIALFLKRLSS
jgi:acetyl esterase